MDAGSRSRVPAPRPSPRSEHTGMGAGGPQEARSALVAMRQASAIASAGTEESVLHTALDAALTLVGAEYGAAFLLRSDGTSVATTHRGVEESEARRLVGLPSWVAAVGRVLDGEQVRLPAGREPIAAELHAPGVCIGPVLAVPVQTGDRVFGALCLGRPAGAAEAFSSVDQRLAAAAATQAAAAMGALRGREATHRLVDSLRLSEQRATDTPPQPEAPEGSSVVIRRLLAAARSLLDMQVAFLARIDGSEQTFTAVEAAPGAPAVVEGSVITAADGYCQLLVDGEIHTSVPDVPAHPVLGAMSVTEALGVGAYCGVPVLLPDGSPYGTLCGMSSDSGLPMAAPQMEALRTIAGLIGHRLQAERDEAQAWRDRQEHFLAVLSGLGSTIALQPIVDLTTGGTLGFEALSRFEDESGTPRSPESVFGEAKQLDVTVPVELAAARSALGLIEALPAGTYLSVNFSPAALLDPAAQRLLAGAPLTRVVVEITEHEEVDDYGRLRAALTPLRAGGMRIAVDDTGAGFASLHHLTELAPDIIKLDTSFVRGVDADPARRAVARAVVGYAAEVGADLVAEGIETRAEADTLRKLGATIGQGYLYGRPQPWRSPRDPLSGAVSR